MFKSLAALNALNFFSADVQDGLGPYLGVFLQQQKWSPGEIGLVMTIGGLAGVLVTTPMGALIDRITAKRAAIAVSAIALTLASLLILFVPSFWAVTASQVATGVVGAAMPAAINAITLGLVRQRGFAHQLGLNGAFNHGGNVAAAVLCGAFGLVFGLGAVFVVLSTMAVLSVVSASFIDPTEIDHRAARGASEKDDGEKLGAFAVLATSKPLIIVALTLLLFHLGNAAMLPLLGQSLASQGHDPAAYTSATIIVAQFVMIPMSILAARLALSRGYWLVFLLALLALPVRGIVAYTTAGPGIEPWLALGPVQALDGVGAGLLSVAVPGLVARILAGTGHVNAGLGAVMATQGIGAALSPAFGGFVAGQYGYGWAFAVLGVVAAVALTLWLLARPVTASACAATQTQEDAASASATGMSRDSGVVAGE